MNKKIANQLANNKLRKVLSRDIPSIMQLLSETEHEFMTQNSVEYQIRVSAFYEDSSKRVMHVSVCVDDQGFWSTLLPLCRSEIIKI